MKKIITTVLAAFLIMASIQAQQTDSLTKNKHIRELLDLTGSGSLGKQVMSQIIETFKQQSSQIPEQFWTSFMEEVNPGELVEMIVPIYAKHFTDEDILGMIQFYKSPLGQRMVKALPAITKDSYEIGGRWGQELAAKVLEKMKADGYLEN